MKPTTAIYRYVLDYCLSQGVISDLINKHEITLQNYCKDIQITFEGYGRNSMQLLFRVDIRFFKFNEVKQPLDDIIVLLFADMSQGPTPLVNIVRDGIKLI